MATWDESSAVSGGMQGAAVGTAIAPGVGTAVGALIGGVTGGIFGGKAKDAAKEAEKRRQEEIKRAIERQNQKTYDAKVNAEQWALSDLGLGEGDLYGEAVADREEYAANADLSIQRASSLEERFRNQQAVNESRSARGAYVGKTRKKNLALFEQEYMNATKVVNRNVSQMYANEGLISTLEDPQITRY